jgi:hypothetical protein
VTSASDASQFAIQLVWPPEAAAGRALCVAANGSYGVASTKRLRLLACNASDKAKYFTASAGHYPDSRARNATNVLRPNNASYIYGPPGVQCDCWEIQGNGQWDGAALNSNGCPNYTGRQNFVSAADGTLRPAPTFSQVRGRCAVLTTGLSSIMRWQPTFIQSESRIIAPSV